MAVTYIYVLEKTCAQKGDTSFPIPKNSPEGNRLVLQSFNRLD